MKLASVSKTEVVTEINAPQAVLPMRLYVWPQKRIACAVTSSPKLGPGEVRESIRACLPGKDF